MNDLKKLQNGSDIRGVAMEGVAGEEVNLTSEAAKAIGSAFALWLSKKSGVKTLRISIGRDSRLSGEMLKDSFAKALWNWGMMSVILAWRPPRQCLCLLFWMDINMTAQLW